MIALKDNNKELTVTKEDRLKIIKLGSVSNGMHTLSCKLQNYFLSRGEQMPVEIEKEMESIITMVDSVYVDEAIKNICHNAIKDGFTMDEFEKQFNELCIECEVEDIQSLMDCALDMFYEESEANKAI